MVVAGGAGTQHVVGVPRRTRGSGTGSRSGWRGASARLVRVQAEVGLPEVVVLDERAQLLDVRLELGQVGRQRPRPPAGRARRTRPRERTRPIARSEDRPYGPRASDTSCRSATSRQYSTRAWQLPGPEQERDDPAAVEHARGARAGTPRRRSRSAAPWSTPRTRPCHPCPASRRCHTDSSRAVMPARSRSWPRVMNW